MRLLAVAAVASVSVVSANAQTSAPLKTLEGYRPTLIQSEEAALSIYKSLPTEPFKGSSGCFQRAHNWSFQMAGRFGTHSMKAFLFFTSRYQREFAYEWAYHVAPLVSVKMADGSVQDLVMDPTFVNTPSWAKGEEAKRYDNKPISVEEWTRYFIFPEAECPVVDNYRDFADYQERYYCYIMKTPMYTYIPRSLDSEDELFEGTVRTNWRIGDLEQMKKAFKFEYRN